MRGATRSRGATPYDDAAGLAFTTQGPRRG